MTTVSTRIDRLATIVNVVGTIAVIFFVVDVWSGGVMSRDAMTALGRYVRSRRSEMPAESTVGPSPAETSSLIREAERITKGGLVP